uniref:Uncharacterized protein n=1 Tax=Setaria viridis TaxID=4556 RepID=A0A4U6VLX8_SETVI|nr:hypothetical protein SEVIR_2G055350v2 [Setaria viridis]
MSVTSSDEQAYKPLLCPLGPSCYLTLNKMPKSGWWITVLSHQFWQVEREVRTHDHLYHI